MTKDGLIKDLNFLGLKLPKMFYFHYFSFTYRLRQISKAALNSIRVKTVQRLINIDEMSNYVVSAFVSSFGSLLFLPIQMC